MPRLLGYGHGSREPLNVFEYSDARAAGRGAHLAFNAPSREAVDAFYEAAMAHGGTCAGKPGLRKECHDNYYACFVYDPDGNKLEAVYQQSLDGVEDPSVLT